jgi:hypothetical protein
MQEAKMIRIYLDWLRSEHAEAQDKARKGAKQASGVIDGYSYEQGYVDALAEAMKHLEEPAQ